MADLTLSQRAQRRGSQTQSQVHDQTAYRLQLLSAFPTLSAEPDLLDVVFGAGNPEAQFEMATQLSGAIGLRRELDTYRASSQHDRIEIFNSLSNADIAALTQVGWSREDFITDDGGGGGMLGFADRIWDNTGGRLVQAGRWVEDRTLEPLVGLIPEEARGAAKAGTGQAFALLEEMGYTGVDVFTEGFRDAEERGIDTSTTGGILQALFTPRADPFDLDTYTDPNQNIVIRSLHRDHNDNERFVRQAFVEDAQEILGGHVLGYSLAFEVAASKTNLEDAAQGLGWDLATMQSVIEEVGVDTIFDAVEKLEEGKVSPGRIFADAVGIDPSFSIGTQEINVLSGLTDMGFLLATDPLNLVASGLKARRAVTWGIDTVQNSSASRWSRGIDDFLDPNGRGGMRISLFSDETVKEAVESSFGEIAEHAARNDLVGLLDTFPEMNRFKELFDANLEDLDTIDKVTDFFRSSEVATAFLNGRTNTWRIDAMQIPHLTRAGRRKLERSRLWKARIDWAADDFATLDEALSPEDLILPEHMASLPKQDIAATITNKSGRQAHLTNAEVRRLQEIKPELYGMMTGGSPMSFLRRNYVGQKIIVKPVRGAAKLFKGFTTQIPQGGRTLNLSDDAHFQDLRNLVEMGLAVDMPKATRDLWLDGLMQQSAGARLEMLSSFYDEMFTMAGVKNHQAGREWAQEFIDRFHHAYGHTEGASYAKYMGRSGFTRQATVLPITQSVETNVIPDFRKLVEHSRRGSFIEIMYRSQNQGWLTKFMSQFWKPMVLLRLGFIPRAAGEEFLSAWLRKPDMLKAFPARWASLDTPLLQVDMLDPKVPNKVIASDMMRLYNPDAALPGLRWTVRVHNRRLLRRSANDPALRRRIAEGQKLDLGELPLDPDVVFRSHIPDDARKAYEQSLHGQVLEGTFAHPEVTEFGWDLADSMAYKMLYNASDFMRHGVREGFFHLPTKFTKYLKLPSVNRMMTDRPMFALGFSNRGGFLQVDPEYLTAVRSLQYYAPSLRAQTDLVMNGASPWMDEELRSMTSEQGKPLTIFQQDGMAFNEVEVVELQSPWELYGLGDPYFAHMFHSRVQRTLVDPGMRAAAQELQYYISPSVVEDVLTTLRPDIAVDELVDGRDLVDIVFTRMQDLWLDPRIQNPERIKHLVRRWLIHPDDPQTLRTLRIEGAFEAGWLEDIDEIFEPLNRLQPRTKRAIAKWLDLDDGEAVGNWTLRYDDARQAAAEAYRRVLTRPEFARKVELSERMHMIEGQLVSNPVPRGHTRLYVPQVAREVVEQLSTVANDVGRVDLIRELEQRLRAAGLPQQAVRSVIDGLSPDNISNLLRLHEGRTVPLMSLGISDPKVAQRVSEFFDEAYEYTERSVAGVYAVDIKPDKILEGTSLGRTDNRIHRFLRQDEVEYFFVPPRAALHSAPTDVYAPNFGRGSIATDEVTREMAFDEVADQGLNYLEDLVLFRGEDLRGEALEPELLSEVLAPATINRMPDDPLDHRQEVLGFTQSHATIEDYLQIPGNQAPKYVAGPQLASRTPRKWYGWSSIVRFGFDRVIGPSMNAMVRRPMFIHQYAQAYRDGAHLWRQFMDPDIVRLIDGLSDDIARGLVDTFEISKMTPTDIDLIDDILTNDRTRNAVLGRTTISRQLATRQSTEMSGLELQNLMNVLRSRLERGKIHPAFADDVGSMVGRLTLQAEDLSVSRMMDDITRVGRDRFFAAAGSRSQDYHSVALGDLDEVTPGWMFEIDPEQANVISEALTQFLPLQKKLATTAANRAVSEMVPFIDDHRFRSQFQEWTYNLIPFWYAEEQFIKRWARVLQWNPAAFHQAQLLFMGLENVGFFQDDPVTGESVFIYPGSPAATELISRTTSLIFGGQAGVPISMPITGKVRYASPGLDRLGIPSAGPLVSIPMTFLANRYPDWDSLVRFEELATGQRGSSRPLLHHLMPAFVRRIWSATGGEESNQRLMSATNNAMMVLEAHGHGVDETATPREQQIYIDRVKNSAQHLMFAEAFFSWLGPSAPSSGEIITDPQPMSMSSWTGIGHEDANMQHVFQRYLEFLDDENTSYDDVVKAFIANYPDASPFVVFDSEIPSGAPLPTTGPALDFIRDNEDMLTEFPMAGPWLVSPDEQFAGEFDYDAWAWHLSQEWRLRQGPDEFWEEMVSRSASREFYERQELRDEQLAEIEASQLTDDQKIDARRQVNDEWRNWSRAYDQMHPIFADRRQSGEGRNRRREVINQIQRAIDHPDFPTDDHSEAMAMMVRGYNRLLSSLRALQGDQTRVAREERDRLRVAFSNWGTTLVEDVPSTRSFWSSVIVPEARLEDANA